MSLTEKDLRAIELWKQYNRYNLTENLKEYHFLIDTLVYLHEAIAEVVHPIQYWQKLSETLLYKFAFHGLTLHNILSGLQLRSEYYKEDMSKARIVDIASAKVILRAQLECFLMYHFIYVNPEDDDLRELRYNAWIYSSLLQRQNFPSETEYARKQKEKDRIEMEKMKKTISNLRSFKALSPKQQQSLLMFGSSKLFNHWSTILKETGFSESNPFFMIYTLLSIYSHSEGLSIVQMGYDEKGAENTNSQANLDLHHSKLLVCLMITSVTNLFTVVKDRFDKLPEQTRFDIELYSMMAMRGKP